MSVNTAADEIVWKNKTTEDQKAEVSKSSLKKAAKLEKKQQQKDARLAKRESESESKAKKPPAVDKPISPSASSTSVPVSTSSLSAAPTSTPFELNPPAGMRDIGHAEMLVRNKCINDIRKVFLLHGGQELDTPVLERREVLLGNYGEDNKKLVFDVQDQTSASTTTTVNANEDGSTSASASASGNASKQLTMRFDLTVPFARHMAATNRIRMKRFQIAKVYRRDNPSMAKGRMREFYQADFDISGDGRPMLADAEVITVLHDTLQALPIGPFAIKISHRRLLEGLLAYCGLPMHIDNESKEKSETKESLFTQVCSSIDKLDKHPWSEVREELIVKRGLTAEVADRIGELMTIERSCAQVLLELKSGDCRYNISENAQVQTALNDLKLLFHQLEIFGVLANCRLSLSLARGLGYYDGVIFEAVSLTETDLSGEEKTAINPIATASTSSSSSSSSSVSSTEIGIGIGIGSIGAGGRYDNLVGKFRSDGRKIPTVGCSIGIERIMALLRMKHEKQVNNESTDRERESYAEVLIHYCDEESFLPALTICRELWDAGVTAEVRQEHKIPIKSQIEYALDNQIPFLLVIGSKEVKAETVQVRTMTKSHDEVKLLISRGRRNEIEETIPRSLAVQYLVNALSKLKRKSSS